MALLRGVFIVAAKRTPFGAYGGLLKDFTATDLTEFAARAALAAGKVPPETIDSVIVGNVMQSSVDAAYLARHVGLRVGVPIETPALTLNRLCGSGFQSVMSGCQEICDKAAEVVLCGGTESMSQAPYCARNIRFGTKLGADLKLEDTLWAGLTDQHVKLPMGITAENLASKHNISREDCDKYALQSQQRWKAGPVSAITGALKRTGLSLKDMDMVEVNEAFASQYLAVERSLGLDPSKTNMNGGAIALGHPLGASGSRITAHLVHELRRRGKKYGVGSACIGGGQGIAVIVESMA
uniref:Acetyl-CoA acyltransferase 2 n=1 Tax=Pipistrellus kuhlii TaxID=59472 RepID=A0A7J7Y7F4_PIPKU|nr:acetyl-CoA acyltransferase 2 [Pipistrellus kuhlii]